MHAPTIINGVIKLSPTIILCSFAVWLVGSFHALGEEKVILFIIRKLLFAIDTQRIAVTLVTYYFEFWSLSNVISRHKAFRYNTFCLKTILYSRKKL